MTFLGITSGSGVVRVTSAGLFGWVLRWLTRIPRVGDTHPVRLEISTNARIRNQTQQAATQNQGYEEVWTRRFGAESTKQPMLCSRFRPGTDGTLHEHCGPVAFVFEPKTCGDQATLQLRHSQVGPWRVTRRWLNIRVRISASTSGGSRTAVEIDLLGGKAATLRYVAELASEETR